MKRRYLFIWISVAVSVSPACAQGQTANNGYQADFDQGYTAASGQPGYTTGKTVDTRQQTAKTTTRTYQTMLQGSGGTLSAQASVLAPTSVNPAPIGKQSYSLGFPTLTPAPYTGAYRSGVPGAILPPTSTSSVDINIFDTQEMGPDGFGGPGFGSTGGGGGSGGQAGDGSSGAPPDLPPGWTGVDCHGV